jgi:hypothetical protein
MPMMTIAFRNEAFPLEGNKMPDDRVVTDDAKDRNQAGSGRQSVDSVAEEI